MERVGRDFNKGFKMLGLREQIIRSDLIKLISTLEILHFKVLT
jgi:hypothetical protein